MTDLGLARLVRAGNSLETPAHRTDQLYQRACHSVIRQLEDVKAREHKSNHQQLNLHLESLRKHHKELSLNAILFKTHQNVLKLQMQEKRTRKEQERMQNAVSRSANYFRAEIPHELLVNRLKQQRDTLGQDLQRQISEKQENLRKIKQERAREEHLALENAKRSLSKEQDNKKRRKNEVCEDLRSSWDLAIKAKRLRNDIDKLRLMTMAESRAQERTFTVYLPRNRTPVDREQVLGRLKLLSQREEKIRKRKGKILNSMRAKSSAKQSLSRLGHLLPTSRLNINM